MNGNILKISLLKRFRTVLISNPEKQQGSIPQ